ncbi:hypothetical protein B0H10DRAFT_599774 [Mycena sp. CBHHK59/15]|nr:hypothetical protein B0H10DRAFT_599774 [Mycena sp. CBHHK59/15]
MARVSEPEWKERGSTACGPRALELVCPPFALALPSRPQSMGRAAEREAPGVDHVPTTWCGPTPHLLCEGAADTHPPCDPRASPTSACRPSARVYHRGTRADRPRRSGGPPSTSVLGFLMVWPRTRERDVDVENISVAVFVTRCVCSSGAHPTPHVRVHPGSRRIPVAVAHRAQAAPAFVASPAPPRRLFTVAVSLRAPLAPPTI